MSQLYTAALSPDETALLAALPADHTPEAADARALALGKTEAAVPPRTEYCYTQVDGRQATCPYWALRAGVPHQLDGYCALLGCGDQEEDGTFLLWDQVKECGISLSTLDDPEDEVA